MRVESETWLCIFGVLVAILLRCTTSLHPHSGQGKPPMFGDYEAQRHWMEITVNLPLNEWYYNTSRNDLEYWGLDYPPLTAYHSYICGKFAEFINPDFVALNESRGYESEEHKLFMRYTVLIVDFCLYIPAIILYFILTVKMYKKSDAEIKTESEKQTIPISIQLSIILALFYPGMILIDHGHFQYNCVSLAFAIYAITFLCIHQNILASIFFCLALNYKQMELYHSLPFFLYLLSTCVPKPGQNAIAGFKKLFKIGLTVIITFFVIWAPFLTNINDTKQVLHRLFPVARGVFEDKVANVWCALNVIFKFKLNFTNESMLRYCTIVTLTAVLPSGADLFLRPNVRKFVPALINSSLAFFLFSFQVHEKSILLAVIPVILYSHIEPLTCFWFLIISLFSMFPLIVKDELVLAFVALTTFYVAAIHIILEYSKGKQTKSQTPSNSVLTDMKQVLLDALQVQDGESGLAFVRNLIEKREIFYDLVQYAVVISSLIGCVVLMLLMLIIEPPENYPDVFPLLISAYSCVHFVGFFIYFNIVQFKIPQAVEDVRHIKLKSD
ncbi:hypothetical protein ILUMI_04908 [Ignelater luminosus]|uniref:Alpha-1,3-glucosyltransferase n=1 Tax=Ignelater luminosus TaxID=2038154 RepID=A0A8K0DBY7_IGNLU|nr:hypothetical protein ILUMI_04908 [Ignelater luminosus]